MHVSICVYKYVCSYAYIYKHECMYTQRERQAENESMQARTQP